MAKPREARGLLERALAMRESYPEDPLEVARTRFALARALWDTRADRARAVELADKARLAYTEAGDVKREQLAAVEEWLKKHRAEESK
jgi:hypothetical protein